MLNLEKDAAMIPKGMSDRFLIILSLERENLREKIVTTQVEEKGESGFP
jgi:hypothetical protein